MSENDRSDEELMPVEDDDRTVVVPGDATIAVRRERPSRASRRGEPDLVEADAIEDDATAVRAPRKAPDPAADPEFFKRQPRTRNPLELPFQQTPTSLPKRGVRPGIPVLYPRQEVPRDPVLAYGSAALEARLGAPPAAHPVAEADRSGIASVRRRDRRFRRGTLIGFGLSLAVSVAGLWTLAVVVLR